jgi:hypothetical protein
MTDAQTHETPERQKKIRIALNEAMKSAAQSKTDFDNSWRKQLERKIERRSRHK